MPRPPADWTKTGTVVGYADWLRKKSDAICVVVICPDRNVLCVDPDCRPRDAQRMVEDRIGDLAIAVDRMRRGLSKDGRVELPPVEE
jgi:cysteine synthase